MNDAKESQEINIKPSHFSFRRTLVVTKRVLRQISRDKRTFGMLIIMPIIIMLIFGFALGGDIINIPIVVENADTEYNSLTFGDNITSLLQEDDRVYYNVGDFIKNKENVDNGLYYAAIYIPPNFSESIFNKSLGQQINITILIYIDATKPAIVASILGALQEALQDGLGSAGIIIDQENAFGGVEFSGLDTSIPSVMGYILTFLVLLISLLTIKRESLGGTEERLYATPLRASERLIGYSIALTLLSLMMVTSILGISIFIFGATIQGELFLLFLMFILYAFLHVVMAIFLSNFAKNELQGVQIAALIALPSLALSGMLIPVNSFPFFIQVIARGVPLFYGNHLFESIMLKGWNITQVLPDILVLLIMTVVFFLLAIVTVKDKIIA